jgi:apolipoprotein N-acyltransferase
VSSVITPTGKELARLDALEEGIVTAEIEMRDNLTLYTRIGNLFVYLCFGGITVLLMERAGSTVYHALKNKRAKK